MTCPSGRHRARPHRAPWLRARAACRHPPRCVAAGCPIRVSSLRSTTPGRSGATSRWSAAPARWCSIAEFFSAHPPSPALGRALPRRRDPAAGGRAAAAGEVRQARPGRAHHLRGLRLRAAAALGARLALLAMVVAIVIADAVRGRKPWRTAFNIAQYALAYGAASLVLIACSVDISDHGGSEHRCPRPAGHRRGRRGLLPGQRPAGGRARSRATSG